MIDIFHKDGVTYDHCNFRQILTAAASVVFRCVREDLNYKGGYIRDIGKGTLRLGPGRAARQLTGC